MKRVTLFSALFLGATTMFAQLPDITFFDGEFYGITTSDNGEGGAITALDGRIQAQSGQSLALVQNPLPSGINTSEKVLEIVPAASSPKRVITMLRISDANVPAGLEKIDITGYVTYSFKYYAPELAGNVVRMQWNASETNPVPSDFSPQTGSWQLIEYTLPTGINRIQMCLNQTTDGQGVWDEAVTNRNIYLDDVKVSGNTTGISAVGDVNFRAYTFSVDGRTSLALQADGNLSAELYTLSGQKVNTLFQGNAQAGITIPVAARAGIYLIKITDGTGTQTFKTALR